MSARTIFRRAMRSRFASTSSSVSSSSSSERRRGIALSSLFSSYSSFAEPTGTVSDKNAAEEHEAAKKSDRINRIGQPTPETHPHLFESTLNELTPGTSRDEYKSRREKLGKLLPENAIAILLSGDVSHYPNTVIPTAHYRQDSDFMYFTGMMQPHAAMMIVKDREDAPVRYVLFTRRYEKRDEIWNGWRAHPEAAAAFFECDESVAIEDMEEYLKKVLNSSSSLYSSSVSGLTTTARKVFMDKERFTTTAHGNQVLKVVADGAFPTQALKTKSQALRWRKSESELKLLQKSASVNLEGIVAAMRRSRTNEVVTERDLMNAHEYTVKSLGADRLAFPTVMGASNRATIIHYYQNDRIVHPNDLCLMDAGCELNGYVSDITRVWAGGSETASFVNDYQKAVYDRVCDVRAAVLARLERDIRSQTPVSLYDLHVACVDATCEVLVDLLPSQNGRESVTKNSLLSKGKYAQYFPHAVSHWLGMDTHDTPLVPGSTSIEKGVCFSVEPGLYFDPDDATLPKSLRGVGVRIEDEVCVNARGAVDVLSRAVPVDREELDAFINDTSH
jgi:Xaa-Pro aminopeptidase